MTVLRIQNGQIGDFNYAYRAHVTAVPGAAATPKEGRWCCSSLPAGARLGMAVATGTEVMLRHEKKPGCQRGNRAFCGQLLLAGAGYSAMKSRVTDESTLTPGPMVELSAMLFT